MPSRQSADAPDISVLIPARDASAFVALALKSVLYSKEVRLEVVLVDHASSDDTASIVQRMAAQDARVRLFSAPACVGLAGALEVGRAECRSPFIARFDADDLMHPQRLMADVAALTADPTLDAVCCRSRLFPREHVSAGMRFYVAWQNAAKSAADHRREIWIEQPICHPATTFRARALDAVGGYRDGDFAEDYDLFLRLLSGGARIEKRQQVHHGWREHGDRATYRSPRYHRDVFARLKVEAMTQAFDLKTRPVLIAGAGKEGGRIGRTLLQQGVTLCAYLDIADKRIGRWRHGVMTHSVKELPTLRAQNQGCFLIGAVGTSGARGSVRATLTAAGFIEGKDAVVVA